MMRVSLRVYLLPPLVSLGHNPRRPKSGTSLSSECLSSKQPTPSAPGAPGNLQAVICSKQRQLLNQAKAAVTTASGLNTHGGSFQHKSRTPDLCLAHKYSLSWSLLLLVTPHIRPEVGALLGRSLEVDAGGLVKGGTQEGRD